MRTSYLVLYRVPCLKVVMVPCSLREESINIYFLVQSRRSGHLAADKSGWSFGSYIILKPQGDLHGKKETPHYGLFCFVWLLFFLSGTHVFGSSQKNCNSAPSLLADSSRHWVQIYWLTEEMLIHIAVTPQPKSAFLGHIPIPEVFSSRPLGSFTEKVVVGLMVGLFSS